VDDTVCTCTHSHIPRTLTHIMHTLTLYAHVHLYTIYTQAAGLRDEVLTHADVTKVAKEAGPRFEKLLREIVC